MDKDPVGDSTATQLKIEKGRGGSEAQPFVAVVSDGQVSPRLSVLYLHVY